VDIDTLNRFAVSAQNGRVVIVLFPWVPLSPDDALLLAAWLVAIAEPTASQPFAAVLEAVTAA
jgi:hypothetical protein